MLKIEKVINELVAANERGESISIEFNRKILSSDNIDIDEIYKKVTKRKKAEFYKKVDEWIENGMEYIYPEKEEKWITFVHTFADSYTLGSEIDCTLGVLMVLDGIDEPDFTTAKDVLLSLGESGGFYDFLRNYALLFSPKGPDFYIASAHFTISDENLKTAEEIRKENILLAQINEENKKAKK